MEEYGMPNEIDSMREQSGVPYIGFLKKLFSKHSNKKVD
jgi:hypothetical protein